MPAGKEPVLRSAVTQAPRGWTWVHWTVIGLFGVLGIAGIVVLAIILSKGGSTGDETGPAVPGKGFVGMVRTLDNKDERVFRLLLHDAGWVGEREARSALGAVTAWRNVDWDVWLAVVVRDYGTRKPREAELIRVGVDRLEKFYGETLEMEAYAEPAVLSGRKVQRLAFKGQIGAVVHWGELYMFAHHGFGYWFFIGGPTEAETQQALAQLEREKLGLVVSTQRSGWRDQPPRFETFTASSSNFTMAGEEGVWEKFRAKNEDERGELSLLGRFQEEKEAGKADAKFDNRKNAAVLVVALDPQPDLQQAMKAGVAYVETKKKEEGMAYRLDPIGEAGPEAALGKLEDIGNRKGRIAEFTLKYGEEPQRYMLVGVVNEPGVSWVIRCDSTWQYRQIWREDFRDLLRTFKAKRVEKKVMEKEPEKVPEKAPDGSE